MTREYKTSSASVDGGDAVPNPNSNCGRPISDEENNQHRIVLNQNSDGNSAATMHNAVSNSFSMENASSSVINQNLEEDEDPSLHQREKRLKMSDPEHSDLPVIQVETAECRSSMIAEKQLPNEAFGDLSDFQVSSQNKIEVSIANSDEGTVENLCVEVHKQKKQVDKTSDNDMHNFDNDKFDCNEVIRAASTNGCSINCSPPLDKRELRCDAGEHAMDLLPGTDTSGTFSDVEGEKLEERNSVAAKGDSSTNSRKKLLVLDVNGLLVAISSFIPYDYDPDEIINRKAVFRRPYCNEFLKFCFENFIVGMWSSRTRRNVEPLLDYLLGSDRQMLAFTWDQSHCTNSGFYTVERRDKPILVKKLKYLWEKREPDLPWEKGEYDGTNTLLVDDTPYKALSNPRYNAIFPASYWFTNVTDNSLGPGGDLRVYLEGLAAAENVQDYVKQHPFGQRAITEKNLSWRYYLRVIEAISTPPRQTDDDDGSCSTARPLDNQQ